MLSCHCQKIKFFIKNFFNKCDQIHRKPQIWPHLLKKFFKNYANHCKLTLKFFLKKGIETIGKDISAYCHLENRREFKSTLKI